LNHRDLEDAIWGWADKNTPADVTVIWSRANSFRPGAGPCPPGEPYVTLQFTAISQKTGQDTWLEEDDTTKIIGGQRTATVSSVAYGPSEKTQALGRPSAAQIIMQMRDGLDHPEVWASMRKAGLSVHNEPVVQDVSSLLETGFQDRSNMDLVFGFAHNQVVETGAIERVQGESEFEGADTISETFDIQ